MGSIDTAVSAAGASVEFSYKRWKELAWPLSKLYALQMGIMLLVLAVGALLFLAVMGGIVADVLDAPWGVAILVAVFAILLLPVGIVMGAISTVAYNVADTVWRNAPEVRIIESARRILAPFAVYAVVQFGVVSAIIVICAILAFIAFSVSPAAGFIGLALLVAVSLMAIVVISFLFQFATIEIALNGTGGIEAMRKSASLVRKNLAATIVFDLILIGVSLAIGTLFSIATQAFSLMIAFAAIIPGLFIGLVALMIIIYFVQTIAIQVIAVPMKYRFWKDIGGRK